MYKRMRESKPSPSNSMSGDLGTPSQTPQQQPPGGQNVTVPLPVLQSGQPVIIIQYGRSPTDLSRYNARAAIILGAIQIASGIAGIIVNIMGLLLHTHVTFIGYGIWGGVLFILAGSFGVGAGRKKHFGLLVTCMVLSIIASVAAGIIIIISSVGLQDLRFIVHYAPHHTPRIAGIHGSMVIIGLLEFTAAIASSVLCCMPLCCHTPNRQENGVPGFPRVMYMPTADGQGQTDGSTQVVAPAPQTSPESPQNAGVILQPQGLAPSAPADSQKPPIP